MIWFMLGAYFFGVATGIVLTCLTQAGRAGTGTDKS
jgi:hypothetical protein